MKELVTEKLSSKSLLLFLPWSLPHLKEVPRHDLVTLRAQSSQEELSVFPPRENVGFNTLK